MRNKKRIGITLRVETITKYNEKRDSISQDWTNFIEKMDAVPVFIPNTLTNTISFLEKMNLDSLFLSGGDNIGDEQTRDTTEKNILDFGIEKNIPIFGICRGMQVINKYFGGNITKTNSLSHVGKRHNVKITNSEFTKNLSDNLDVNSYHKNIIHKDAVGNGLGIFAISESDNTVEGIYHKKFPILGVMWHPEREEKFNVAKKLLNFFYDKNY